MTEASLWPIVAAGIASTLLGWVWYHPKVFGTAWMRMSGITPEMAERGKKRMPLYALIAFLASMIVAYVMRHFAIAWGVYEWVGAVELGLWLWIGFVMPPMLGMILWEHKPVRLYLINTLYWLVAFVAIAIVLVLGSQAGMTTPSLSAHTLTEEPQIAPTGQEQSLRTIEIGGQTIRVSVADSPETRKLGLSGRPGLDPDEGMLFVFPLDGEHAFWMKDMHFSIDILWLTADGGIVYLEEDISPDTYPTAFASTVPARYVLELPAGFVRENSVTVGDIVRL